MRLDGAKPLFLFLLLCPGVRAALTTVSDTLKDATGTGVNGTIQLQWQTFYAYDGTLVQNGAKTVTVTNGTLSVNLEPNASSSPSSYYLATYQIANAPSIVEKWIVPISASPVTLQAVRVVNPPPYGPFVPNYVTVNNNFTFTGGTSVASSNFTFTQHPSGALSAGATTITLAPMPQGVNGSDGQHYLYVSGTGTPEACLISGGSGIAGQTSGQIQLTCAGGHSAGWSIQSASGGIKEASVSIGGAGTIEVPTGTLQIYGPLVLPSTISLIGQGSGINGSARGTTLNCATAANPCLVLADGIVGEASGEGIGVHARYNLTGTSATGTQGVWFGGDPSNVFAPSTWWGSYIRFYDVTVQNFDIALTLQQSNFVSFFGSVFSGVSRALVIPSTAHGPQPGSFHECVLTVPSGIAVQQDTSNFLTTAPVFMAGQISGTYGGNQVNFEAYGVHFEPNNSNDPIVNVTSSAEQQVRIVGGLLSTHGSSTPYQIQMSGTGLYDLNIDNVWIQADNATTVPTFLNYASSTGGRVHIGTINVAFAGVFTKLFTIGGTAQPSMSISVPQLAGPVTLASATALAFPNLNFPYAGLVHITLNNNVTSVSGLLPGTTFTMFADNGITFLGATLTANIPYTCYSDGATSLKCK